MLTLTDLMADKELRAKRKETLLAQERVKKERLDAKIEEIDATIKEYVVSGCDLARVNIKWQDEDLIDDIVEYYNKAGFKVSTITPRGSLNILKIISISGWQYA